MSIAATIVDSSPCHTEHPVRQTDLTASKLKRIRTLHIIESLRDCGGTPIKLLRTSLDIADKVASSFACLSEIGEVGSQLADMGFPVTVLKRHRANPLTVRDLVQVIKQQNIDVVCTHFTRAGIWGRMAALWAGKPAVHHWHGLTNKGSIYRLCESVMARFTSVVVVNSRATANFVKKTFGLPRHKIRISYPYVPFMAKRRSSRNGHPLRIGTVGGLNRCKGHDTLIRAFSTFASQHPHAVLEIVGDGILRTELQSLAEELGIADKVHIRGYQKDIAGFLSQLDMFVFPSVSEGFGIALVEAMLAGVPVICSDADALPEIVTHGKTGLIVPKSDPQALAGAMQKLLANPAWAEGMVLAAHQEAKERFCLNNRGQYAQLLQTVVDQSRRHTAQRLP